MVLTYPASSLVEISRFLFSPDLSIEIEAILGLIIPDGRVVMAIRLNQRHSRMSAFRCWLALKPNCKATASSEIAACIFSASPLAYKNPISTIGSL
jgi:hypothetical protein